MPDKEKIELLSLASIWEAKKNQKDYRIMGGNLIWECTLPINRDNQLVETRINFNGTKEEGSLSIVSGSPFNSFEAWQLQVKDPFACFSAKVVVGEALLAPYLPTGFVAGDDNEFVIGIPRINGDNERILRAQVELSFFRSTSLTRSDLSSRFSVYSRNYC